jgi:hypothetical protein
MEGAVMASDSRKTSSDKIESEQATTSVAEPCLMVGEALRLYPSIEENALSQLLLLRCGDSRLIGSQVIEQAKVCGQAVKAAFKELHAVDAEE